ncbi:MAG: hypothetical protein IJT73_10995 [Selenomonadaceae bacterium]|nr:hypothetical protein [Selenomonadaceae bacterium]
MQIVLLLILTIAAVIFIFGTWRALKMSKKSVALIEKYENDKKNPALIQEIFDALREDFRLNKILQQHNATLDDIKILHRKLMKWGDFRKYNRYVPITSFFNVTTLKYLLEHKNDDAKSLTEKMMNHFHI